ncbi:AMP-binding protein [Achromobacter denitrificans]
MRWTPLPRLLLPAHDAAQRRIADDPVLTRDVFAQRSLAIAASLRSRGARRLALWFDDAAALAIALFACWRAGVTAVLPGDALPATCAELDAAVDAWLSDTALPVPAERRWRLEDLESGPSPLAPAALDPGVMLELRTSGSSGAPKLVCKRWEQLTLEVQALREQWPGESEAAVLGSVSAQHMYGLPFRVLWPLCAGRAIDRRQRLYPEDLQQASLRREAVWWIASPALLRRLGQRLDAPGLRGRLTRLFSSGGALPDSVADDIERTLGLRPTEIYGSSETGAVAWREDTGAWSPLPGVQAGAGADGALHVRAPWIAARDERTADAAEALRGGFRLLGRLDRIVKIEEKRVALPMLEAALLRHPYASDARVGQAGGGARLAALVALSRHGMHALRNQGRLAVIDALRSSLKSGFEPLAIPRRWRLMKQLPWNAQGKLTQAQFEQACERPAAPAFAAEPPERAGERRYAFDVPPDLAQFSGHFPAAPVVPGVAQIGWAADLALRDLDIPGRFAGIEALKFQRLMRPGDAGALHLRWDAGASRLYFTYTIEGATCSSGRILQAGRP